MAFEKPAVIIDNGSYNIKAGFACDNHPVSIFRNLVGRPKWLEGSYGKEFYDVHIGDDAYDQAVDLDLSPPVVNGRIVHWDNMERIWHYIFYRELRCAPEDRAVILAVSSTSTVAEKTRCCEVFFETLNAPGLCVQAQPVLAIYGSGLTTGLCIDVGHDVCNITPIFEGGMLTFAHMTTVAGAEISRFLDGRLATRGLDLKENADEVIEDIKRNHCVVASTASLASVEHCESTYTLRNGKRIDISTEKVASEILFRPRALNPDCPDYLSIQDAVQTALLKCDPELREELYETLIPSGGIATMPGFFDRLQLEVEIVAERPVEVLRTTEPYCLSWLGAATFATLPDVEKVWVMQKQFQEHGERIVRKMF